MNLALSVLFMAINGPWIIVIGIMGVVGRICMYLGALWLGITLFAMNFGRLWILMGDFWIMIYGASARLGEVLLSLNGLCKMLIIIWLSLTIAMVTIGGVMKLMGIEAGHRPRDM